MTVFSLASNQDQLEISDKNFILKHYVETKFSSKAKLAAFSGTGLIHKMAWLAFWRLTYRRNRAAISAVGADIFWIRDFAMLTFVPKRGAIIFEMHGIMNKLKVLKLRFTIQDRIAVLAPISKGTEEQLDILRGGIEIVRAPMGIEGEFLETEEGVQEFLDRVDILREASFKGLEIGYIGKFSPNGYSKGIEDLLELARFNLIEQNKYKISIIGGTNREVIAANHELSIYGLTENDVKISGHISHHAAIAKMKELDVLVLPMPASKKYVGFPLKSIESIASGRIVIAARCTIYKDIFNQDFEPYWYEPGNAISMDFAIKEALSDESLRDRITQGITFSSRFTWDARTKTLLDSLRLSQYNSVS